jgi:hypothetical protein
LSSHLRLGLPSDLFSSAFPTKTLYVPHLSPIRASCPAHLILLRVHTGVIYFSGAFLYDHPPVSDFICQIGILCVLSHVWYSAGLIPLDSLNRPPHTVTAVFICPYKSASLPRLCGCETREIMCYEIIDFEESLWTHEERVTGDKRKAHTFW